MVTSSSLELARCLACELYESVAEGDASWLTMANPKTGAACTTLKVVVK